MSLFFNNNLLNDLLNIYDRVMLLNVFVDGDVDGDVDDNNELQNKYYEAAHNHNNKIMNNPYVIDAGFDLYAPGNEGDELAQFGDDLRFFGTGWDDMSPINKLDYKICCSAKMVTDRNKIFNTGFYMYPRSSISKIQLRLANSTGIIDAGYRGHLTGMFDVVFDAAKCQNDSDDKKYKIVKTICDVMKITPKSYRVNYTSPLRAQFDVVFDAANAHNDDAEADFFGKKFDRYVQICAPGLVPILVEVVGTREELGQETERGNGGFGSTGRQLYQWGDKNMNEYRVIKIK